MEDSNVIWEALKGPGAPGTQPGDSGQQATTPAELSVVQKSYGVSGIIRGHVKDQVWLGTSTCPFCPFLADEWATSHWNGVGVIDVTSAFEAEDLAEAMLAVSLPRRWRHVRSVARRARWVPKELSLSDDLVAAAWLHDIGYAPELVETGFHPLDGARYLRREGIDGHVVSLVAYHSCAQIEADVRGLGAELTSEFSPADPVMSDALLYCDMTTGPDGDYVRPADRLVEVRGRYGPDHEVTRFVERAASEILTTAGRVEEMLPAQPK